MKTIAKLTLVTAITMAAGMAQANPWGYGFNKVDYKNSFNTDTKSAVSIDSSKKTNTDYRLNYDIDNSRRSLTNIDTRLNYRYDLKTDNINANQSLNQVRGYSSNVGQSSGNVGGAAGHSMNQSQGGTSVGSLVSETSTTKHKGHSLLSPSYTTSLGNVSKGNMYGSHIGGSQSGLQMGNVVNAQNNTQNQNAYSGVVSTDAVSNTASK
ncbi:MAG: hypothetical protein V7739_00110 [Motiliproteus sp.]